MKTMFLFLSLLTGTLLTSAQQKPEVKQLVNEGIRLHDAGDYEGALKKYDEALKLDENDFYANFEKSLTLMQSKKYKDCVKLCKWMLEKFTDNPNLHQVYTNYGSALDELGKPGEAIDIFDEAIRKFPGNYLLYFNKGVTQMKAEKYNEALVSYQETLTHNGLHPSSNYYSALILEKSNRIPSLLSLIVFILSEPRSQRTKAAYTKLTALMEKGIKRDGNNINITMDAGTLGDKDKPKDNDFGSIDIMFTLLVSSADNKDLKEITKTPAGQFSYKLQLLISSLDNGQKEGKGFYWKHTVPFFVALKENNYAELVSHLVMLSSGDADNQKWIQDNEEKVGEFYEWLGKYKWQPEK